MKKQSMILILGIMFLFSLTLISAVPPVTKVQEFPEGYTIEESEHEYLKLNEDYQYNFFVYNDSTGIIITNETINCTFYLANASGNVLMMQSVEYYNMYWSIDIYGGNFSESGSHPYGVICQDNYGGALAGIFEVNPTGTELLTSQSIFYGFVLLLIGMFLFFSISGMRKTEEGGWLILYICLTYILIYVLMGILLILTGSFLWATPIIENVIYIVWFIMGVGFLPFVIILSLYILGQETKAGLEENYMKQGYTRDEARDLSKKNKI